MGPENEHILRLHLLRVRPGFDRAVLRELDRVAAHNKQEIAGFYARAFVTLGEYDVLVFTRAPVDQPLLLGSEWIPHILGVRELPTFCWSGCEAREKALQVLDRGSLTVTFLQMNPAVYTSGFFRIEQEVADRLGTRGGVVLGLFGVPELVVVRGWNDIRDIDRNVIDIRKDAEGCHPRVFDGALIYRTLTLLALEHDPTMETQSPSDPSGDERASLAIQLSCFPNAETRVRCRIRESFGPGVSIAATPGALDMSVGIPTRSGHELRTHINRLLSFREQTRELIIETLSSLQLNDIAVEEQSAPPVPFTLEPVPLSGEDTSVIHEQLRLVGRRVVKTIFNFNDIATDPRCAPSLLDLRLAVEDLASRACAYSSELRDHPGDIKLLNAARQELANSLVTIHEAVHQRTVSPDPSVTPIEAPARYFVGGVSRLFQAVQSIPISVFRQSRQMRYWWGYAVAGVTYPVFYHQGPQVLNVPPEELWHPEHWFVIIHESIHAYLNACREETFRDFDDDPLQFGGVLKRVLRDPPHALRIDENVLKEIVVDILTYNCGPAWDARLYFSSVWEYLVEGMTEGQPGHASPLPWIIRNTCVWLAARAEVSLPEDNRQSMRGKINEMLADYRAWEIPKPVIDGVEQHRDALEHIHHLFPILRFAMERRLFGNEELESRRKVFENEIDESVRVLARGEFRFGGAALQYPELVVWKVRETGKEASAALRRATILKLLECYWHQLHAFIRSEENLG